MGNSDNMTPAWIAVLIQAIKANIPKDFVGQVEVNIFKGGVSNVNVRQSFKAEDPAKQEPNG
jgi:hypothetical protein